MGRTNLGHMVDVVTEFACKIEVLSARKGVVL
jgi:hypothetical protein